MSEVVWRRPQRWFCAFMGLGLGWCAGIVFMATVLPRCGS